MRTYDVVKRSTDILVAGLLLVISAPIQVLVAVLVRVNLGSPVIFRQQRPGKDEQIFELRKFRTMKNVDEGRGLITDEQRLTKFGALLRSTSLDELPTLWNVLRGDMSLVGPRPLLVEYLPLYSEAERRRHEVRPGITGLAQVSGRNSLSWAEKFSLDLEYVETRSLGADIGILARTATKVLRRSDISAEGQVTMEKFIGNPSTTASLADAAQAEVGPNGHVYPEHPPAVRRSGEANQDA